MKSILLFFGYIHHKDLIHSVDLFIHADLESSDILMTGEYRDKMTSEQKWERHLLELQKSNYIKRLKFFLKERFIHN